MWSFVHHDEQYVKIQPQYENVQSSLLLISSLMLIYTHMHLKMAFFSSHYLHHMKQIAYVKLLSRVDNLAIILTQSEVYIFFKFTHLKIFFLVCLTQSKESIFSPAQARKFDAITSVALNR